MKNRSQRTGFRPFFGRDCRVGDAVTARFQTLALSDENGFAAILPPAAILALNRGQPMDCLLNAATSAAAKTPIARCFIRSPLSGRIAADGRKG